MSVPSRKLLLEFEYRPMAHVGPRPSHGPLCLEIMSLTSYKGKAEGEEKMFSGKAHQLLKCFLFGLNRILICKPNFPQEAPASRGGQLEVLLDALPCSQDAF